MPHADEGQIHAYLDRQGEFADPVKRRELGKHIADCSQCTRVLKDARRLRSDAEELLRTTRLREVQAPPFAEIAARADSRNQQGTARTLVREEASPSTTDDPKAPAVARRRFPVWRSLAWAATVVLAVGIGWSIRPILKDSAVSSAPAAGFRDTGSAEAAADERLTEAVELADESTYRQADADASPAEPASAPLPAAPAPAETARVGASRADTQGVETLAAAASNVREREQRVVVADSVRRLDSVPAVQLRGVVTTGAAEIESAAIDSAALDSSRRLAERELTRSPDTVARPVPDLVAQPRREAVAAPIRFESDRSRLPGDWNVITREEAEQVLGGPLVWVPELEIVGLGRTNTANGVRVMQSAGSGALLELEIRAIVPVSAGNRDATRPIRIRVMSGGDTESSTGTATIGRYLITAKAGFPEASLRRFLQQLTYAPTADQLRNN